MEHNQLFTGLAKPGNGFTTGWFPSAFRRSSGIQKQAFEIWHNVMDTFLGWDKQEWSHKKQLVCTYYIYIYVDIYMYSSRYTALLPEKRKKNIPELVVHYLAQQANCGRRKPLLVRNSSAVSAEILEEFFSTSSSSCEFFLPESQKGNLGGDVCPPITLKLVLIDTHSHVVPSRQTTNHKSYGPFLIL